MLILIFSAAFVSVSHSFDPPWVSPPYPWGHDTTEWIWKKIPWGPSQAYYNPEDEMFYLCGGNSVQWPTLRIELFIEMELEFDFGMIYPQSTDEEQDFTEPLYLHGTAQSDVPALFRIITEDEPNQSADSRANGKERQTDLEWAISTDGGHTYNKLKENNKIWYHKFDSWLNPFIIKMTLQPDRYNGDRQKQINAIIYPLPQN
jgi:hypothetical protein